MRYAKCVMFQQIAEYPNGNMEAILRSLLERIHNVHFIFSGSKQHAMEVMYSSPKHPFYRSTERLYLGSLDEAKYYAFARQFLDQKKVQLSEAVFHQIYDLAKEFGINFQSLDFSVRRSETYD